MVMETFFFCKEDDGVNVLNTDIGGISLTDT